jgi:hypothetical protein
MVNSPFSRFNLGTMEPAGAFRSLGMGGIGTAVRSNTTIFVSNPASYSSFDTISFIFDFGIDYSINKIAAQGKKYSSDDVNFDHIMLAFPLAKGIGLAAGILPFSNGYYNISETVKQGDPTYDPVTGGYTTLHTGEGGLSRFFIGTGAKINQNFSAGVNLNLLLGQVSRLNKFNFDDYYNVYNNNSTEKLQLSGVSFDLGAQYTKSLGKNFLNAGVSITTGAKYSSKYENLSYRYTAYGLNDTLTYVFDDSTRAFIPGTIRAGIAFGRKDKFVAGLDYVATNWSKARIPGAAGYTGDTRTLLLGLEYIPEKYDNFSYLKRIEYRIGGHIGENYLVINGKRIKESGVTAGIGLPLRKGDSSTANLYFDYTRRSASLSYGNHREDFLTFGASLNFYDRTWFWKRKYQ